MEGQDLTGSRGHYCFHLKSPEDYANRIKDNQIFSPDAAPAIIPFSPRSSSFPQFTRRGGGGCPGTPRFVLFLL